MNPAQRLVTSMTMDHVGEARLHEAGIDTGRQMTVTVVLQVELSDGRRVVLLDDRGWAAGGPSDIWSYETLETMAQTARTVVGPDEPPEGRFFEEETALHWAALADIAREQGVAIEASELAGLRHDVEASADIHARLAGRPRAEQLNAPVGSGRREWPAAVQVVRQYPHGWCSSVRRAAG